MRSFVSGKFLVAPNCLPVAGQDRGIISRRRPHSNEDITAIIFDQDEDDTDVNGPGPSRGGSIRFISDTLYSGVKDSIDDPKVFDPPSYCNATLSATPFESLLYGEEHEVYSETMERFVLF